MLRALSVVIAVTACRASGPPHAAPAPPASVRSAPATAPGDAPEQPASDAAPAEAPSWVGIRLDDGPLRITQVIKGAPGDRAGLAIGDEVLAIAGKPLRSAPELIERVRRTPPGTTLDVVIMRGGIRTTLKLTVEQRPASPAKSALIDKPAPGFTAIPISGPFSAKLADLVGHVIVVDFWATWCGPCTFTIPRLNDLHQRYGARGLRVVGLSSEDPQVIRKFVTDKAIAYTIAHDVDDEISRAYLRGGIPMFVVIDKAGVVRHVVVGADVGAVEAAVIGLLDP